MMVRYVCMLRGVNVGGSNKISMSDLRALFEALGHHDIATYIQSGNVILSSERQSASSLSEEIEQRLAVGFGLTVRALLRSADELDRVVAGNPFLAGAETSHDCTSRFWPRPRSRPSCRPWRTSNPRPMNSASWGRKSTCIAPQGTATAN